MRSKSHNNLFVENIIGISLTLAIICFIASFIALVVGATFAGLYGTTKSDYVYDSEGFCNITSQDIFNATCSYECNCVRCGKTKCCGTCYYLCNDGYWNITVSNNPKFTTDNHGWIETIQKRALKGDYDSVVTKLETRPIGTVSKCFYDSDNHKRIDWNKSYDPEDYMIVMISFLSFLGLSSILFVIFSSIACVSWWYIDEKINKKKSNKKNSKIQII